MKNKFNIVGGSIIGKVHKEAGKNNHDAYNWIENDEFTAAIVCDGCGSGQHSEVGAKIGSRLVVEEIARNYRLFKNAIDLGKVDSFLERVQKNVLARIRLLALEMGGSLSKTINDYFLFTVVGALIVENHTVLFSVGDGLVIINSETIKLGPFPNNEPPYLAYGLVESSLASKEPGLLKIKILKGMPTEDVNSILIGTDGVNDFLDLAEKKLPGKIELVGHISQFWENDKYFRNPDMVRRRLSLVNRDATKYIRNAKGSIKEVRKEAGLLPDDTTMVVIRKSE
ncbi:MAG: protein phosphatase 2C domain-containing protein [Patescibacteria group bacterium]